MKMKSRVRILVFSWLGAAAILWPETAFSQQRWQRTYGGTRDDEGYSVQQTSDGGYIIAGFTSSFGAGGHDVYLIKTDPSGNTLWTRTYGGVGDDDEGRSVQQTSDGGYIIAGWTTSFGAGGYDVYLIKTNASGNALWTRTYGGASDDRGYSVQQTQDGGYIITGFTFSFGAGYRDVYLIKTNASGDTLWTRTYSGASGMRSGFSVRQTSDGGYIVAGWNTLGRANIYLIKTNASGDTLWTRAYGGRGDYAWSVWQNSDGGYIIAGFTYGALYDVYLIRTNPSGDTLWTRTYGGPDQDAGTSVQQTSDGGFIIAGFSGSSGGNVYLIKTNASGDTLWTRTTGGGDLDVGWSVRQTSDGGYIIAGYTYSFSDSAQVYLIKTDANGSIGVEEESPNANCKMHNANLKITPNPFISFATILGHESERFALYDISGKRVGTYRGDRIGEGLLAGVYFVMPPAKNVKPVRIVKVR